LLLQTSVSAHIGTKGVFGAATNRSLIEHLRRAPIWGAA